MNDDQILTIEEAAQFLKMTEKQVYELTRTRSQERMEYPFPAFSIHSKAKRVGKSDLMRELLRARRCVKETHQIADVSGLQDRPGYAQFLGAINHARAMPPESGGERNRGESFFFRPEPGPNLCAFRRLAMASGAAALGKDALANQRRSSWLEVPQARKERPQIRHLVVLKNRRRNPVFASLSEHRGCVVPQNAGKLPRREWKITLWPQLRTHAAALPAHGMALYASVLEHRPTLLCVAGYFLCFGRRLGSAETHIRDQKIGRAHV